MITRAAVHAILDAYLARHPGEADRLRELREYLAAQERILDRANPAGHLTTSAFLLDPATSRVLLVEHRSLRRHLQPGGHVEGDVSLVASALRELREETGVPASALRAPAPDPPPVDIDIHVIPANPRRGEPAHPHFDFRYLFRLEGAVELRLQEAEVTGAGWYGLDSPEVADCFPPAWRHKVHALM